jgi:hypothetical protein
MTAYSRDDVETDFQQDGVGETRKTEDGGMTIAFERWNAGLDATEMFKDLPDGACWEQHWGYVLKGSGTLRYTDGTEETITEGQAYYMKPGHIPLVGDEGPLELLEFTPADQSPDQKPPDA